MARRPRGKGSVAAGTKAATVKDTAMAEDPNAKLRAESKAVIKAEEVEAAKAVDVSGPLSPTEHKHYK